MSKHTPAPWRVEKFYMKDPIVITSHNGDICLSSQSDDMDDVANAEHIVRCVNSHDALVEALKDAMEQLEFMDGGDIRGIYQALKDAEA